MTSVFSAMNSVPLVCCFQSNRILLVQPKHTTRCHRFHCRKDSLPLVPAFFLIQLHSVNLILYKHHIFINAFSCDSRIEPFLEIDVKGGERDHIKAYHLEISHQRERVSPPQGEKEISRGREYSSRKYFSRIPDAWCSRGEMPRVFLRGKDMFICAYLH